MLIDTDHRLVFQDNAKIAQVTENAGVQGPPTSEFYEAVESADTF
ncbi:hypothetical protein OG874_44345 [Nocardia sp. NBC_00565]|nr:hypothetical protein [Nocardia sp. NBC_00565]WUC03594.1 hypothetical protein OG874_44345 [Nocardia sp. NBC_00565]